MSIIDRVFAALLIELAVTHEWIPGYGSSLNSTHRNMQAYKLNSNYIFMY